MVSKSDQWLEVYADMIILETHTEYFFATVWMEQYLHHGGVHLNTNTFTNSVFDDKYILRNGCYTVEWFNKTTKRLSSLWSNVLKNIWNTKGWIVYYA